MADRRFSEVELRAMMEDAEGVEELSEPGRWAVQTRRDAQAWQIIVEPDAEDKLLVIITAYPL